jgi:hypothetical protein
MIGPRSETVQKARPLLILVIAMGVLILLVTTVVVVKLVKDVVTAPAGSVTLTTTMLHQPAGSRIVTITSVAGRLGVLLQGGGPDRILFVDPDTGRVAGQLMLGQ